MRRIFAHRCTALALATVLVGVGQAETAHAAWVDGEFATASFTAGVIAEPVKDGQCVTGLLGLGATFSWLPPHTGVAPDGYEITVLNGSQVVDVSFVPASQRSVSTGTLLSTILGGVTYTLEVRAANGSWTSEAITGTFRTGLLGTVSCSW